jgi:hypothetical protein
LSQKNSDELGEMGQDKFKSLCSTESLHANSSSRDRTGWDFRVELPNNALSKTELLDKRTMPEPVMVQIKTVKESTNIVKLKLKTFERFAKISDPAFVMIVQFDQKAAVRLWGIHIVGKALEKTLEKLAKVKLVPGRGLSEKESISFTKKHWWTPIDISKERPLYEYFNNSIAGYKENKKYSDVKNEELESLGYKDDHRFSMKISFEHESEESFYKGLLGLKPLQVASLENYDTRFGLKRPVDFEPLGRGEMTITPLDELRAFFRFRDLYSATFVDVPAVVRTIPTKEQDLNSAYLLINIYQLAILIKPGGNVEVTLGKLDDINQTAECWFQMFSAFAAVAIGSDLLSIRDNSHKTLARWERLGPSKIDDDLRKFLTRAYLKAMAAKNVMEQFRLANEAIDVEDALDINGAFEQMQLMRTGGILRMTPKRADSNYEVLTDLIGKWQTLMITGVFQAGNKKVAYASVSKTKLEVTGNRLVFEFKTSKNQSIESISNYDEYRDFCNRMKQANSHSIYIDFETSSDSLSRTLVGECSS